MHLVLRAAGCRVPDNDAVTISRRANQPEPKSVVGPKNHTPIGKAGWQATLKRTAEKLVRDRVSLSAGSLAYHWFLALFPAVIAILGILAVVHANAHVVTSITHAVEKALPPGVAGVFTGAVKAATTRESGSAVAVIIGLAVALWSASGGMSALQLPRQTASGRLPRPTPGWTAPPTLSSGRG